MISDHKELAKEIIMLKCDVNLAERLGRNARGKVKHSFSIEAVANEYAELCRNVLLRKKRL